MPKLAQQAPKPAEVSCSLHTHPHLAPGQSSIEGLGFGAVSQAALSVFSGFLVDVRNLLEARMKIRTYNHHARLLSSRAFGRLPQPVYSGRGEPTLSCNQVKLLDTPRHSVPYSLLPIPCFFHSDQTPSKFPTPSEKWNRRPPGNSKVGTTMPPPSNRIAISVAARSKE